MFILLATALIRSVGGDEWHPVDQVYKGTPMCAVAQEFADGSNISILVTSDTFARKEFGMVISNPSWSIEEGEQLGSVKVSTPTGSFVSEAKALANGLALTDKLETMEPFLGAAKIGEMKIRWEARGRDLGNYDMLGLDAALPTFQACIARRFDATRDPFR